MADDIKLSDFKKHINAAGIYDRSDIEWYDKFSRHGIIDPYNTVTFTKEYLFFTKPDLHLFEGSSTNDLNEELASYPFFFEMKRNYPKALEQLQLSVNKTEKFMKVLSNSVKNTLDIPSTSNRTMDTSATIYGVKQTYVGGIQGDEDITFSLEFEDTKYLNIYMLFKCWSEYNEKRALGLVTPPDDNYIIERILHDQIAIYKFIVGEDGETLIHFSKLYGCSPTGVPREAFSDMNRSGGLTYSIPWKAFSIEDMDPLILRDFNALTENTYKSSPTISLYDTVLNQVNPKWANVPYIVGEDAKSLGPDGREYIYKLKWR